MTGWRSSSGTSSTRRARHSSRADPAGRDALTQFYIAYTYYRQGWGRVYNDDALFKNGLEAVDRAIALAPDHRLVVDDPRYRHAHGRRAAGRAAARADDATPRTSTRCGC